MHGLSAFDETLLRSIVEILRSPREIAQMRKAGLLVWETFDMVEKLVKPGVSTVEIDAAIEDFYRRHNAEPLFKFYPNSTEGGPPFPAVTCISINREVVHGIPGKTKTGRRRRRERRYGLQIQRLVRRCGGDAARGQDRAPRCSGC